MKNVFPIIMTMLSISLVSCSKDEDNVNETNDDLSPQIESINYTDVNNPDSSVLITYEYKNNEIYRLNYDYVTYRGGSYTFIHENNRISKILKDGFGYRNVGTQSLSYNENGELVSILTDSNWGEYKKSYTFENVSGDLLIVTDLEDGKAYSYKSLNNNLFSAEGYRIIPSDVLSPRYLIPIEHSSMFERFMSINDFLNLSKNCPSEYEIDYDNGHGGGTAINRFQYVTNSDNYPTKISVRYRGASEAYKIYDIIYK